YTNGYVRRPCTCEIAEYEQEQAQRIRLEQWQAQQEARRKSCARRFHWLPADICGRLAGRTFANFNAAAQPDAFNLALSYVESQQKCNLLFVGNCGTGKTHLAAAICNELAVRLVPTRFMTGQGLFDSIQYCMDADEGYQHFLEEAGRAPVLVID